MSYKLDDLKEKLILLKRKHYINDEDCWYSCPASGECCKDTDDEKCNCGAEEHNNVLSECIKLIESI